MLLLLLLLLLLELHLLHLLLQGRVQDAGIHPANPFGGRAHSGC
jgi:hypothetical protein